MIEALQPVAGAPAEAADACGRQDPRSRRTRELLQQALARLLEQKDFDRISVNDITAGATVNRATFYAHYPDKFALLECMVAGQFNALLAERGVTFDGTCSGALSNMVLGVCDFLAQRPGVSCERQLQMEPHLESAVVSVVRGMLLDGLRKHSNPAQAAPPEMRAATISGAIFGAAKEWVRTPNRPASETVAKTVTDLLAPLLH
jgi:AcrR family transcriptional regulator